MTRIRVANVCYKKLEIFHLVHYFHSRYVMYLRIRLRFLCICRSSVLNHIETTMSIQRRLRNLCTVSARNITSPLAPEPCDLFFTLHEQKDRAGMVTSNVMDHFSFTHKNFLLICSPVCHMCLINYPYFRSLVHVIGRFEQHSIKVKL